MFSAVLFSFSRPLRGKFRRCNEAIISVRQRHAAAVCRFYAISAQSALARVCAGGKQAELTRIIARDAPLGHGRGGSRTFRDYRLIYLFNKYLHVM